MTKPIKREHGLHYALVTKTVAYAKDWKDRELRFYLSGSPFVSRV